MTIGSLWSALMLGGTYRNETEIGNVVYSDALAGQRTLGIVNGQVRSLTTPLIQPAPFVGTNLPSAPVAPSTAEGSQIIKIPKPVAPSAPSMAGSALYVDPSFAAKGYPAAISDRALARWFGGWSGDVKAAVDQTVSAATTENQIPVLVAYNIPQRDCGLHSAGGASEASAYKTWIRQFAEGIGQRKAAVVLEPDAIAGMECLDESGRQVRLSLIADAVTQLKSQTGAWVYIDAGNARWINTKTMSQRLSSSNIAQADGFALNVSNFIATAESRKYGDELAQMTGKRYVIDTSRNGNGTAGGEHWCNPRGRALGQAPTTQTGQTYVDAYLWIKTPGESDGECNGGPAAGVWWPEYAQELINNSRR